MVPLTRPSLGDSEEIAPASVWPTEDIPPTDHVQLPPSKNDILCSNSRQRSQPLVPIFLISENGQSLAHSIFSVARFTGSRIIWFGVRGLHGSKIKFPFP